ncbi:MAG: DnaA/Hda family protein, partial [Methylococcales bacterium]
MPTQAPLPLDINPAQNFDTYHSGTNSEVTETLRQCAEGKGEQFIFLWGEPGMGKTHLLHACCQSASQHQITSRYLPLNEFITLNPSAAENLDQHQLI